MQYWDGTQWQVVPVIQPDPNIKPTLALCEGVPTWVLYYCPGTSPYTIGETGPAGGKVFYVTDGGLHGLEAAPVDQSIGTFWGCDIGSIPGAQGTAVGTGAANTAAILAAGCPIVGAAKIADAYVFKGYSDWFLPSSEELNLLYAQKDVLGGFVNDLYWSSSEFNDSNARGQGFNNGSQGYWSKDSTNGLTVRAIRTF